MGIPSPPSRELGPSENPRFGEARGAGDSFSYLTASAGALRVPLRFIPTKRRAPVRYRLKLASWTVVRERGQRSPRILTDPAAVAALAADL
jgi:hypothetical protein